MIPLICALVFLYCAGAWVTWTAPLITEILGRWAQRRARKRWMDSWEKPDR